MTTTSLAFRFSRFFVEIAFIALAVQIFMVTGNGCSDRPEDFQNLRYALGIAFLLAIGLTFFENKQANLAQKIHFGVLGFVRYYLAYVLIGYATAKLVGLQFDGTLADLDTKLGDLPAMKLLWAFFGYSYPYSAFIGVLQLLASLLLLNRRSSVLGACIMLPIMANIVLANYAYDVCVKLFSSVYLLMNLYILAYSFPRFLIFFVGKESVPAPSYIEIWPSRFSPKSIFMVNVLLAVLMIAQQSNKVLGFLNKPQKPETYGAWEIERVQVGTFIDEIKPDPVRWRRMFFEANNQVAIHAETGPVAGFKASYDASTQQVTLQSLEDPNQAWMGKYIIDNQANTMLFKGVNGSDSIRINLKKIENFKR